MRMRILLPASVALALTIGAAFFTVRSADGAGYGGAWMDVPARHVSQRS